MASYVPIESEELVVHELREITDWNELGAWLNVPRRTLKEIERQYSQVHGPRRCKSEVISKWWRRTPNANWEDVITALKEMDEYRLARELEEKYRMNPASRLSNQSDLTLSASGGYTISHGPIRLAVSADIPRQLLNLMQRYADMLLLLRMSSLPSEKMKLLRLYLRDLCDDQLFLDCSSTFEIVDQLKRYISIFNIDILLMIIGKFIEFKEAVQEFEKFRLEFLSNTAVDELRDAFNKQAPLETNVESITLKLKEMGSDFTLKALRNLAHHLFGIEKAMVLIAVRAGCIAVTWTIPVSLVPVLKRNVEQHSLTYLQRLGVLEIVIGHRIVAPDYQGQMQETGILKHELAKSEVLVRELVRELVKQLEEKNQEHNHLKERLGNMEKEMTGQLNKAQETALKREDRGRKSSRSGGLEGRSSKKTAPGSASFNLRTHGLGSQGNNDWLKQKPSTVEPSTKSDWLKQKPSTVEPSTKSDWLKQKPSTVEPSTKSATASPDKKETKGGGPGKDQPVPAPRRKKTSLQQSPDLRGDVSSTAESTKPRPLSFHGEDSLKGYEIVVMDEPPRVTTPNGAKPVPKSRTKINNSSSATKTSTSPLAIVPPIVPSENQAATQVKLRSEDLPTSRYLSPYRKDQNNYSSSCRPSFLPMVDYRVEVCGSTPPMDDDQVVLLDSPHPKPPKKLSPILGRKGSPAFRIKRSSGDVKADVDEERRKAAKRFFKDPRMRNSNLSKLKDVLEKPNTDPNMRNDEGDTPLLHYVRHHFRSRLDRLYLILYHGRGVDVNARDAAGNSALHIAAQKGDAAFAKALLVFGANYKLLNANRQIPIDLARGEIAKILQCLASKPEVEDDDAVASLPEEIDIESFNFLNCRLDHLVSDRNIFNFTYWMENQLDKVNEGAMALASLTDSDVTHSQAMQRVELRRWQDTAKPVRPGGRVLFLDGGGVRGLILVEMLMEIERRTGRKITELFDWFVGTSIGSVVAAGLVYANKSLEEIRSLLFQLKDEVFTGSGFKGTLLNVRERSKKLEELFENEIGSALLSSVSKPRVMICAVNKTTLKVEFFNNFMDNPALTDVPVWKACRASSAAPIYFTSYGDYVDGGVMANNPCEYAMSEITQFYHDQREKAPEFSIAVSVGTGYDPRMGVGDTNTFCKGLLDFKKIYEGVKQLVDLFGKALSESENTAEKFANQCITRQPPIRFFRFNPKLKEMVATGETNDDKLIDMLIETKCYMANEESVSKMGEIITVFRLLAQYHAVM